MAVALDDVSRTYGTTHALQHVSLDVQDGEFFTLVGPSGCGKTTTLRLIAGFESPSEGSLRIGGSDVAGVPPESRDIGVVFQNYALFPHMSVGENIAYGLRFSDPPAGQSRDERVASLLDLVDLSGLSDREPASLSGGQQQRVAIARALAPGPELLLLDEPMSALDARLRERLRLQVKRIQTELGITTVYVTHDQEEALAISDRLAVMHDGRIEQVGTPRDVYRRPRTRFVAEFIGDNNVFRGEVVAVDRTESTTEQESDLYTVHIDADGERFTVLSPARPSGESTATFCVRPEGMRLDAPTNTLTATVIGTEFLGETTRIHLDWGGQELLLRTNDPLEGQIEVGFTPGDAHLVEFSDSQPDV